VLVVYYLMFQRYWRTPLHSAVRGRFVSICALLADNGANLEAEDEVSIVFVQHYAKRSRL
jgi:hypothetical protein